MAHVDPVELCVCLFSPHLNLFNPHLQNKFDVTTKNIRSLLQETPSYGGEHGGPMWP